MKIGGRGGHTPTSPGTSGYIDELKEDRIIHPKVLNLLKGLGHTVVDLTPPDSYSYPSELTYGINTANKNGIELGFSIHFNAGGGNGGSEVWISDNATSETIATANRILSNLNKLGFINRGIKHAPSERHLGEITSTIMPFLIIEVCFTDVSNDKKIYDSVGTDAIAVAIAQGITGQTVNTTTSTVKANDAIRALQYDLNIDYNAKLTVTGIADEATVAALKGIQNIIVKGHKSSVVKWIQQKLIGYGYLAKAKDTGMYDEPTFQAVMNMQKNWGRPTDGILRIETWNIFLNN